MEREAFVSVRHKRWEKLESLLGRAQTRRLGSLSGHDLILLGALYRNAISDLAVARRDLPRDPVVEYLNGLVGRVHPIVYQENGMSVSRIGSFVRYGYPAAFRGAAQYVSVAFSIFALSALCAWLAVSRHAAMADVFLPGKAAELRQVLAHHQLWVKNATEAHSVAANFIMLNNMQVAFFAFAGGMLVGVGTIVVMVENGIAIGTIFAMTARYGLGWQLLAFTAAHGVIELSVIFIAGGAGLMLGDGLLRPGVTPRSVALARSARHAMRLLFGCVPLLALAGTLEAFLSPSDAPEALKFCVGALTGLALYLYLLASRPRTRRSLYTLEHE